LTFKSSLSSPSKAKTQNFSKNFQAIYNSLIALKFHDDFIQIQILFIQKLNHPDEYFYRIQLYDNQFISHKNYYGWATQHNYKLKNLMRFDQGLSGDSYSYYKLMLRSYFSQDQK